LDDPLKPDEALSETRRSAVNDWYDNTLVTRLNNKETGVIIIVMQRLHQDDLVGHVRAQENWEVLSFPAIAEEDEIHVVESPLGRRRWQRKAGEALQPERESLIKLGHLRQTIGEYNFASQYQQNPMPIGGAIVKTEWLKYYEHNDLPSRFTFVLQSWDTANKSGELNDYSVCSTWGVTRESKYLLCVFRRRLNYPDLKHTVVEQARQHHADRVLIEDRASGTQLIQDLRFEGLYGIRAYEAPTGADKILRLYAQTAEFESGHVLLPYSAPWLEAYVRELTTFPGRKYDNQVDSTTQALDHLKTYRSLLVWEKLGVG
jgi:predicted phage terminase large subunit-like protein